MGEPPLYGVPLLLLSFFILTPFLVTNSKAVASFRACLSCNWIPKGNDPNEFKKYCQSEIFVNRWFFWRRICAGSLVRVTRSLGLEMLQTASWVKHTDWRRVPGQSLGCNQPPSVYSGAPRPRYANFILTPFLVANSRAVASSSNGMQQPWLVTGYLNHAPVLVHCCSGWVFPIFALVSTALNVC